MQVLALSRGSLRCLVSRPLAWLCAACLAALWPLWLRTADLGITTANLDSRALSYEVAFLAGLAGGTGSLAALGGLAWMASVLGPVRRVAGEALAIVAGALVFQGLAMALPLALGALETDPSLLAAVLACDVHLAFLGALLLRLPAPAGLRPWLLPGLAWLLPGLIEGRTMVGSALLGLFDVSRPLAAAQASFGAVLRPTDMMAATSLALAAALLHARTTGQR